MRRALAKVALVALVGCGHRMAQSSEGKNPTHTVMPSQSDDAQSGIIYGDDHAYALTAPKGWVLDNQVWADQGIFAVFYPKGSSAKGNWVAYSRVMDLNPKGLLAAATADLESIRQESPHYSWRRLPDLHTSDKSTALVFSASGDSFGNAEFLAYIQAPTKVVFICAVTRTPKNLERLREPFEAIVRSYAWFTDKVITPKP
ncbi:MAG: hypothetical protein JST05_05535 [Acidobacteria bacterium]|nr:hypothetical protein [Acidobacteriota bacterium]